MALTLNIIVLVFEVFYYSLFMKFARREGNFMRYLIAFVMVVLIAGITNAQAFISYALGLLTILLTLKYVVKLKVSVYDLLFIFIMLLFKAITESICYILLYNVLYEWLFYLIFECIKILLIFLLRNKIKQTYDMLKIKWKNNNFYIRYIFTTFMFLYIISAAIYLIVFYK